MTIGFFVAAWLSYSRHGSFWMAIGHGFLSWFYVVYHILTA